MAGATKHTTVFTNGAGRQDGFNRHHGTQEYRSRCAHIKLSGIDHDGEGKGGNRRRSNLVQKGQRTRLKGDQEVTLIFSKKDKNEKWTVVATLLFDGDLGVCRCQIWASCPVKPRAFHVSRGWDFGHAVFVVV
jgi:hypothetical protein